MDDYREATTTGSAFCCLSGSSVGEAYWWLRDHTPQLTRSLSSHPPGALHARGRMPGSWPGGTTATKSMDWPIARSSAERE